MKGTSGGQWDENKKVNTPRLVQGMTEVSFKLPEGTNKGKKVLNYQKEQIREKQ